MKNGSGGSISHKAARGSQNLEYLQLERSCDRNCSQSAIQRWRRVRMVDWLATFEVSSQQPIGS